jgi:small subunit ribosomal protein S6
MRDMIAKPLHHSRAPVGGFSHISLLRPPGRGCSTRKEVRMRRYETIFIITPDSSEDDLKTIYDKIQGVVTGKKGQIIAYEEQGKKKLAYDIKKHGKGNYILMDYLGPADIVAEVERNLRLDERILAHITVKLADKVDPESLKTKTAEPRRAAKEEDAGEEAHPFAAQEPEGEGEAEEE